MHSTLQAELRFTKILGSTCRHSARRQSSKTRSFHTITRLRASQEPPNNASSISGRNLGDDSNSHESRTEIAKEQARLEEKKTYPTQQQSTPGEPPPSENADQTHNQGFYGSSTRRRLRSRMMKDIEPEYQAPEWFVDNNIVRYGEKRLATETPSRIQVMNADWEAGDLSDPIAPPAPIAPPSRPPDEERSDAGPDHIMSKEDVEKLFAERQEAARRKVEAVKAELSDKTAKRYYVVRQQYEEVELTARGLMQRTLKRNHQGEMESFREHLLLQYAGKNGDILLDHIVQDLALNLGCDLMILDAQDIADLIYTSYQQSRVAKAGRMLSYDVFTDAFSESSNPGATQQTREEEIDDDDIADDFDGPTPGTPMGMPMIVGKPITIDLKNLFGLPGRPNRSAMPVSPAKAFSDILNWNSGAKARETPRLFAGIVDSLLSRLSDRRGLVRSTEETQSNARWRPHDREVERPKDASIIHIKNLESIQDVNIGHQFLQELYRQISRRRNSGECILLIGTDSARDDHGPFTKERINDTQTGERDEISQNIVITPVLPNTVSKLALLNDRKQRIATINMRHLWETLRYRNPSVLSQLEPGFWHRDFFDDICQHDKSCLEEQIWSYSYVQRVATYIAGFWSREGNTHDRDLRNESDSPGPLDKVLHYPIITVATHRLKESDESKIQWAEKQTKETKVEIPERRKSKDDPRLASIRASASNYEKRLMGGIIEAKNIATTFNDVHMPVETIDTLQTLTTLSLIRPDAFKYGVLASDKIPGLLLYGPPGTGKTLAAKAVAKESGATMLEVSAADINDMYVGEGEKNVKALFSLAKKLSPCVVFLDEADAMFSARSNSGRRVSHRELLNQFLKEWDGMSNDSGSAFIMVATNRPMDLDDAVLRRLPRRLLVDLPTEPDRLEILKIHLRHERLADDVDLALLAKKTPFYSGSDLKNISVAAALNCVREENELAKQHKGDEPYKHPDRRTLGWRHFEKALEEISASISEDMSSLKDIKKFDEQFGDKKGKAKKTPKLGFPTAQQEDGKGRDTIKVRE
ncbi:uncharacterized protein Z518_04332 [Rhinocladiella mackenziei CBS 650.93]|uniref:AAA+ ATPase domain-containing protein n=1 Tax=Rhinocladiella mackenziei CBS 650.93 TaxID=1442369 RepID=A0A0D2IT43_9EURO|nr:uncharacterized protein Z518_04332 [Rhinocladiella mackenziei CBS 650.93]KIX06356.1 hypothetical protein Z518_04332 [Rhinocladiella mackenziei CBS 650.93]